jgi:acyl-coenzyme A synthetase/AMP-(fatty) acid ligase
MPANADFGEILTFIFFRHVEQHKSNYKWLRGGVEFIDVVPKSPSGKILRRMLRDKEKERMRKEGPKL